jgi:hypothetical protein
MCTLVTPPDGRYIWVCSDGSVFQPDYQMSFPNLLAWEEFFQGRADRHNPQAHGSQRDRHGAPVKAPLHDDVDAIDPARIFEQLDGAIFIAPYCPTCGLIMGYDKPNNDWTCSCGRIWHNTQNHVL